MARICRYLIAKRLPRKNFFPPSRPVRGTRRGRNGDEATERCERPSEADTEGKEENGIKKKGRKEKDKTGKMGTQLFFRLACIVPLAITRLERNVFFGLFLASLISNYESETTRWAAADRITLFSLPRPFFLRLLDSHLKARRQ